jgi:predicted MFS family arabinose efflux permease
MLLVILPRVSVSQQHTAPRKQEIVAPRLSAYRDGVFMKFLFFQLLFAICFFQLFTTIPLYFKVGLHLEEATIGSVMALNGLVIALFEMVLVFKLEGRKPYLLLISYGSLMMGIAFLFLNLPLLSGLLIALIAMFTITIAEMLSMPFMNSYYINRSSNLTRGQYAGLYTVTWSTAQVIGSSTGAVFAERFGFRVLWFVIFGMSVLAAAGFYRMQKKSSLTD